METYLSAVITYYLKPHNRFWEPGEPESTITITAPKKTDEIHLKNIDQEEALHRLSFLADIVDTEGYAIKDSGGIKEDVLSEADSVLDIFENKNSAFNGQSYQKTGGNSQHAEIVNQMRSAIEQNNSIQHSQAIITHSTPYSSSGPIPATTIQMQPAQTPTVTPTPVQFQTPEPAPVVAPVQINPVTQPVPILEPPSPASPPPFIEETIEQPPIQALPQPETIPRPEPAPQSTPENNPNIINLSDDSIETVAKQQANSQQDNEVFVSLH